MRIDPETDRKKLNEYLGNEVDDLLNTHKDEGENDDPGDELPPQTKPASVSEPQEDFDPDQFPDHDLTE